MPLCIPVVFKIHIYPEDNGCRKRQLCTQCEAVFEEGYSAKAMQNEKFQFENARRQHCCKSARKVDIHHLQGRRVVPFFKKVTNQN